MSVRHEEQGGRTWRAVLRWSLAGAAVLAGAAAIAVLWGTATRADAFRFRTLLVNGELHHITPDEVRMRAAPFLEAGFVGIDLAGLQAELESVPWVARATVRREWPGTLRVTVTEEHPVAVWRDASLLDGDGRAFAPSDPADAAGLPRLAGPDGSERELLETWDAMHATLDGSGLELHAVRLSERRAWEVELDDGLVVRLGRRDALPRLGRFATVAAPLIAPQRARVAYVDMRYTNGFAVGWRAASAPAATQEVQRHV